MEALAQPTLGERLYRLKAGLALKDNRPLDFFHCGVPRIRDAFALLTAPRPIDELHLRACNKGGKTLTVAAYVLACLQKRHALDGISLPQWRGKVEAAQLVLDYPQQLLSVQPAYLRMLGTWPHHARYKGEILSSLTIKPDGGSDDESKWSVLHFLSQENRRSGTGVRGDVIAFDEPPRIEILRELRKAAHAGRRSILLIGETPTIRSQWSPLREDYGDTPRMSLTRIDRDRAEVRWSLHEVADWMLSREEKEKLQRRYWGAPEREKPADPLYDARMHGDYIDTTGDCPFDVAALDKMLAECAEPEVCEWDITRELEGEEGLRKKIVRVRVLVLEHAKPGSRYYIDVDPSAGIASGNHDPGGILVTEMGSGRDVAMFEGYIGPYGLGVLAATLAKQYNDAVVDPENNSGWGLSVLRGLADAGHRNVAKERKPFGQGQFRDVLGFSTTATSRPGMIGAVKEWVDAYAAGAPYAACGFRRVIETLRDVILDEDDKAVASPGFHDEFLILKGQSLLKSRPRRPDPLLARSVIRAPITKREPTLEEMLVSDSRGNGNGHRPPPLRPKMRTIR